MKDWQEADVWSGIHREVMRRLRANGMIDQDGGWIACDRGIVIFVPVSGPERCAGEPCIGDWTWHHGQQSKRPGRFRPGR